MDCKIVFKKEIIKGVYKNGKKYYTLKAASIKFNVCKRTVYLWVKAGKLKHIKIGNKFLIHKEEIERMEKGE